MKTVYLIWMVASSLLTATFAYESVRDAAIIARKLVDHSKSSIGTMATVYPLDDPELPGQPFSMQEYYASCHKNGSLTLLFLPISRHSKNILGNPGYSASISFTSEVPAASHARVSLIGNVTIFKDTSDFPDARLFRRCYLEKHPDAKWWLPDKKNGAHISYWARFDPHSIYFVGGFGGKHYIGYIPPILYQKALGDIGRNAYEETRNILVEQ